MSALLSVLGTVCVAGAVGAVALDRMALAMLRPVQKVRGRPLESLGYAVRSHPSSSGKTAAGGLGGGS